MPGSEHIDMGWGCEPKFRHAVGMWHCIACGWIPRGIFLNFAHSLQITCACTLKDSPLVLLITHKILMGIERFLLIVFLLINC